MEANKTIYKVMGEDTIGTKTNTFCCNAFSTEAEAENYLDEKKRRKPLWVNKYWIEQEDFPQITETASRAKKAHEELKALKREERQLVRLAERCILVMIGQNSTYLLNEEIEDKRFLGARSYYAITTNGNVGFMYKDNKGYECKYHLKDAPLDLIWAIVEQLEKELEK